MNEDPFYEKREPWDPHRIAEGFDVDPEWVLRPSNPTWDEVRAELHEEFPELKEAYEKVQEREQALHDLLRSTSSLAPAYHPSHLSRAIDDPGYYVKEPPWWRPFARRRYRIALQVLNDFAEQELTEPPS